MATRTTDLSVAYRGTPVPVGRIVTSAETWFAGSLIFNLAAGNATKTWASALPFIGISPYNQVIAAGGTGIVYYGSYIAIFSEDTTGGIVAGDEALTGLYAEAVGDNYKDLVKRLSSAVVVNTSFVGNIIKASVVTDIWVGIKPNGLSGAATVNAATVAAARF